jgi:hypothetical protein
MCSRISFALVIATLVAASCAGSAQAANYTWQGGDGAWTSANWTTSAGTNQNWATVNTAVFNSGTQTLTLNGNIELDNGGGNFRFFPTTDVSVTMNSGSLSTSVLSTGGVTFYNNSSGFNRSVTLTFNDVALRGARFQAFGSATTPIIVVLNSMRNTAQGATITSFEAGSFNTLRISASGNLPDSVKNLTIGNNGTLDTFVPITLAGGTFGTDTSQINTNGNNLSFAQWNLAQSANRGITLAGSGTLSASMMLMRHTSGTAFKSGTGTVVVDNVELVSGGNGAFSWRGGTNIVNGTTGILGNWSLFSGATLGGSGTLSFAPTSVLTGSAGSFFTADMTAGGLDIQGTLALAQSGSGVTMRLGGPLPTSGTTTLMSWTTLSTGSFKTITYFTGTSLVTLEPDVASSALDGGMVSYTAVPNSLVFIAVPEPATVCLLAGGAAILGGREIRRRRRRAVSS